MEWQLLKARTEIEALNNPHLTPFQKQYTLDLIGGYIDTVLPSDQERKEFNFNMNCNTFGLSLI